MEEDESLTFVARGRGCDQTPEEAGTGSEASEAAESDSPVKYHRPRGKSRIRYMAHVSKS